MSPGDLMAVAEVERATYEYPWSPGIFRDCMLAGYPSYVLEREGRVIGYGIMSIAASEAHILNLCVHPDYQRCGFGKRLLESLLCRARESDVEKVYLEVRPSNVAARKLYGAFGFEEIGLRPGYYQANDGREDAVILSANLDDTPVAR